MITRRSVFVLVALLAILTAGLGVNLSNVKGQESPPTSFGRKCAICLSAGCPDRSTSQCASASLRFSAGMAADVVAAGFEVEVGAEIGVVCYQGPVDDLCVVDPQ